ncbi:MAG: Ig-like domain repeat protein [Acidobacteriaceae bacterium]
MLCISAAFATATAQTADLFPGTTAVGASSLPVDVSVFMVENGVIATPQTVTLGIQDGEFVLQGGTCTEGTRYSKGQSCDTTIVFQPKYPGIRSGAVLLLGSDGTLIGRARVTGFATGSLSVLSPGEINTVAGAADWLYQGDGVPAAGAPIFLPMGVVVDAAGNIFLADSSNNRIRRVDAQTGLISTVAGDGIPGYSGDGGLATAAMISNPGGLVLDGAGNLYFDDTDNDVIRRVDAVSGIIWTVAGTPQAGGYAGDGGLASAAKLSNPEGLAMDASGNLYIADTGNNVVREVNAATGSISTVAGTGTRGYNGDGMEATAAELSGPWSLCVGPDESLYIADTNNQRIRMVAPSSGMITTLAGNGTKGYAGDGGASTAASLNAPAAVVLDPAQNVYVADSGNNRIREISVATGTIQTISGSSTEGFSGDGGPANLADMYGPYSLSLDQNGNLFFSDMFNNRVREIYSSIAILPAYPVMRVGKVSAPLTQGLLNDGNANLTLDTATLVNARLDAATTTCNSGSVLTFNTAGNGCSFGVDFAPEEVGADISGSVTAPSDAGNSPGVIQLSGEVLTVQPTTTSLASSVNPSLTGNAVTFTAVVSAGGDSTTGTLSFSKNGAAISGCSDLSEGSNEEATCTTSGLALGSDAVTASYSGDANDAASVSPTIIQVVKQPATVVLAVSPNPVVVTANVTLTATVTAATGTPTGTVTFYDGSTAVGSSNLNGEGIGSFSTTALAAGMQHLTAQYSGDGTNAAGTSNAINETVQQATTTSALASSSSTDTVGNDLTFTATVTSADGLSPTGTVKFMNGATILGSGSVGANGTAILSLSSLAPGTYTIVAVYSGDTDDAASTSSALSETIQQIPTATTLTANTNPISAGAMLNLNVDVAPTGSSTDGGVLSGSVTFSEGATVYGVEVINSSGNAVLPITTLTAGSHNITASYAGDTNYASSTSAIFVQTVQPTATTTTLSSQSTSTLAGQPASFTASVSSATVIPSGDVDFEDGGVIIGQGTLNAQGVSAFSTKTLAVATHTITAVYLGDQDYSASASAALQQSVELATSSLSLVGPSAAVDAGMTFGVTIGLSSNGVAPSGAMALRNGDATIATQSVATDGTFSFANLSLGVGSYQLTAAYSGDANNAASVSNSAAVTVQLTPTVTSIISSASPSTVGVGVTFTATATGGTPAPTGLVEFVDGTAVLGSASVGSNGSSSLSTSALAFGVHSIAAIYEGDVDHAASTSAVLTEKIVETASVALTSSTNPSVFGSDVFFVVKITGAGAQIPTGQVELSYGSSMLGTLMLDGTGGGTLQVAALPVGLDSVTAVYGGDSNYSASSVSLMQTVQDVTSQVALTVSQNPAIYATPITFTATVTGNVGEVQWGSVNFMDGGAPIGSGVVNANGVVTLTLATLAPGIHSIVASYSGGNGISASSSSPQTLLLQELTSSVLSSSANPTSTLNAILLTATVKNNGVGEPSGTLTFTDGSNQLGVATLNGSGVASLAVPSLSAGNHFIVASYDGDGDNVPSTSSSLAETVQLRATTTALSGSVTNSNNPLEVTLIAVVNWSGPVAPTGTVTFTAGSTVLGSGQLDSIGVATLDVTMSSQNIVAAYGGDGSYAGSGSLSTLISGGTAIPFSMQVSPSSLTLQSKQHASTSVTLTSLQGFTDTLQLGCLGLPNAATCTFTMSQAILAANGTVTVQLVVDTGDPLGAGATADAMKSNSDALFCFLPCLLWFGFGARRRNIWGGALLVGFCMLSLSILFTGCSGLTIHGTPAGTYTFQVTASGEATGAIASQPMVLTVTQ